MCAGRDAVLVVRRRRRRRRDSPLRAGPEASSAAAAPGLGRRLAAESSTDGGGGGGRQGRRRRRHGPSRHGPRPSGGPRAGHPVRRFRHVLPAVLRRLHRARHVPELPAVHLGARHHRLRVAAVQRLDAQSDRLSHLQPGLPPRFLQDPPLSVVVRLTAQRWLITSDKAVVELQHNL